MERFSTRQVKVFANKSWTERTLILSVFFSGFSGILSVTTNSVRALSAIRSYAGPLRTAWVHIALTDKAP